MAEKTMRAAQFHNHHDIRVESIPTPALTKQNQVHVEVAWCGLCGSDLHEYVKGPLMIPPSALPVVQGHELCGYVRSPPPGSKFKDGDPVIVDPHVVCRSCEPCKSGATYGCQSLGFIGSASDVGGYSECVAVEERMLHRLPPEIPMEFAAVVEPLAVVHHAIKQAGIQEWEDQSVLVLGGGPIGFAMVLCLRAHGAKKIYVSEPTEMRQRQIAEFADVVLNPVKDDVAAKCKELTDGQGVDFIFDCAGVQPALDAGFAAAKLHAQYIMVAVWEQPMLVPNLLLLIKHISFKGVFIYDDSDFPEVIQMLAAGQLQGYEKMVTSRISLEDIVSKGFAELEQNRNKHIKILMSPKKEIASAA